MKATGYRPRATGLGQRPMVRIVKTTDTAAIEAIVAQDAVRDPRVVRTARRIVTAVRERGDDALLEYARKLDRLTGPLEVSPDEILAGAARVRADVRRAIRLAVKNVTRVSLRQVPRPFAVEPVRGVLIEQRVTPLARVGCYVPAGRTTLPSSLIMSVVPARAAGVPEVIVVCSRPDDAVCAAFVEAGATRLFRIGGAQAIAALAYGTRTVPAVQRIAGPGNAYVAAAKAIVSADCPIDFNAGPSEIVVISDTGTPEWIAADLEAQAEHDPDARAIFITANRALSARVAALLTTRGTVILASTRDEAIALVNRIAPEHAVCDDRETAAALTSAGTIFVGPWSAQAAGDYTTGSNHILPTGGAGRFRGGLSAADFVKITSVQTLSQAGFRAIASAAITLAATEGLPAHAVSMRMRLEGTGR